MSVEETLLEGILSLLERPEHLAAETEQRAVVAVVYGLECSLIPPTKLLDEVLIRQSGEQPPRESEAPDAIQSGGAGFSAHLHTPSARTCGSSLAAQQ